jgi:Dolichyl-phosphate-mannose-protein mannosyltransferase
VSSLAAVRPRALSAAVPVAAWLTGLVALSILARYGVGRRMVAPWIMVDEVVYSELAKGIASGEGLSIRGAPAGLGYGLVYPALISPAYLLDSLTAAYAAVKAINAVLISLAAVPAYLLARRVLTPGYALAAALLAISVPSLFYAGTVMTENAFYPIVLAAALALVLALERPSPVRVAAFLAAAGVAYLTRPQAVFLVPAALTAPLLLAWWSRRARTVLDFRWLYGGIAAVAVVVLGAAAARGDGPLALLGAYRAATTQTYSATEIARWLVYHLGELDLYLGIAPFAAFLLLLARARRLEPREQAFLAAATALSTWLLVQVAAFATQPSVLRIEERNMFYAAPLFFVALLLWIRRGAPRPLPALAGAVAVAVALPAFIPYARLIGVSATSDTLALLPLWWVHLQGVALESIWIVVVAGAAAIALLVALVPRPLLPVLPALILVLYGFAAQPVDARMRQASVGALFQGITRPERDWVDEAVGRDADVAVLWTAAPDRLTVHENEFFSRSVGDVYYLGEPVPGGLPQTPVSISRADGSISPIAAPYLLTDRSLPIEGRVVAADPRKGLRLYRLDGPARVSGLTEGVYADLWSRPEFVYTGFRCDGGRLLLRLQSDARLFTRPQTVTASVGGRVTSTRVSPAAEETTMSIPLAGERCVVRIGVTPTAVPARVQSTSDDTRRLGIRVLSIDRS